MAKCVRCNGLKLRGALEEFSIHSRFLGSKNAKINFLKKINVLSAVFTEIQEQVIANCLVDLKKHRTLDILLMTDFL